MPKCLYLQRLSFPDVHATATICVVAVVALLCWCMCFYPAFADTYFLNGKQITSSTYQAAKNTEKAVAAMKNNKTSEAIALLRRAVQFDPQLAEARAMLGIALARQGETDEAEEQLRTALARKSDLLPARINLAAVYQAGGKLSEAVAIYEELLREQPTDAMAPALKERVQLLKTEIAQERDAARKDENARYDKDSYYPNVIAEGRVRWPASHSNLRVYVYSGEGLNGFKPEYDRILRESFAEWEKASAGRIRFQFSNTISDADIVCKWVDGSQELASSAEGGEANVRSLLGSIVSAKILLSTNDVASAFPLTENLVHVLCLHEIGHAVGLIGHSGSAADIMYCSSPVFDREKHLSKRDVNTLRVLYSQDVDIPSQLLSQLEHATHGRAAQVLQAAVLGVVVISAFLAIIISAIKKSRSTSKRKKRKSSEPRS